MLTLCSRVGASDKPSIARLKLALLGVIRKAYNLEPHGEVGS